MHGSRLITDKKSTDEIVIDDMFSRLYEACKKQKWRKRNHIGYFPTVSNAMHHGAVCQYLFVSSSWLKTIISPL